MVNLLAILATAYVIGSFPTSIVTSKLLRGIDIRQHGSGNAGGTNVFRVLGAGPGLFVMAVDIFKGFAATFWISRLWWSEMPIAFEGVQLLTGAAVIAGHIWTLFAGFRGGKGVGTAAGMLLAIYPVALSICLLVFAAVFAVSRIVSLSSMSAAMALPVVLTLFKWVLGRPVATALYLFSFLAAGLILFTHRSNIRRLLAGTEHRFGAKRRQ